LKWITKLSADEKLCFMADCWQLQKEINRIKNKKFDEEIRQQKSSLSGVIDI